VEKIVQKTEFPAKENNNRNLQGGKSKFPNQNGCGRLAVHYRWDLPDENG
jgi:hypothetical protein